MWDGDKKHIQHLVMADYQSQLAAVENGKDIMGQDHDPRSYVGKKSKRSCGKFISLKKESQGGIPKNVYTVPYLIYAYGVPETTFKRWRKALKNCGNLNIVRTVEGYYGGSTVVPVVVPVFWSLVPTQFLTNFLYELKVGQTPAGKPESGRVCGSKGSPKVLLGRLGGRGKVRPNAKKKLVFLLFVSSADLFLFLVVFLFFPLSSCFSS